MAGKFNFWKTPKGNFMFNLEASNKHVLLVSSSPYASLSGVKAGMQSVINFADSPIEDQTLKKFEELKKPKWEIYLDKAGKFRLRLIANNGNNIAITEDSYTTKDAAKKGIESVRNHVKDATMERVDK